MTQAIFTDFMKDIQRVIELSRNRHRMMAPRHLYLGAVPDSLMVIVFNPVAGRRRAHLLWRVLDVLVANGVRLDLVETHRAGHAESLTQEAVRRGEPMVVAAGGDGTIAEVANGLMGTGARQIG